MHMHVLGSEYKGINQEKPSVFFASAQCEHNQIKAWKSEWWKNATGLKKKKKDVVSDLGLSPASDFGCSSKTTTCLHFGDTKGV